MYPLLALSALIAVSAPAADRLFVSPMGEPFQGDRQNPPSLAWFAGADADKDGRISIYEFQDDAQRFFKTLDTDGNGEIDPVENERYELLIQQAISDTGGGFGRSLARNSEEQYSSSGEPKGNSQYVRRSGASSYNWLAIPQPVMSADINFNRGVTTQEFDRAAVTRFRLLDKNGDNFLDKAELPRI
jgi:hypothetical protein